MQSWNKDAATKRYYVSIARKNEKAGHFAQGLYWGTDNKIGTNLACWCKAPGEGHELVAQGIDLIIS